MMNQKMTVPAQPSQIAQTIILSVLVYMMHCQYPWIISSAKQTLFLDISSPQDCLVGVFSSSPIRIVGCPLIFSDVRISTRMPAEEFLIIRTFESFPCLIYFLATTETSYSFSFPSPLFRTGNGAVMFYRQQNLRPLPKKFFPALAADYFLHTHILSIGSGCVNTYSCG
jgi:hypothetical protein